MADDFMTSVAEFGLHIGMKLIGKGMEPSRSIDRTALANAIVEVSAKEAAAIVSELGLIQHLNHDEGDFGTIVGIIAGEHFGLVELLTEVKLSYKDCSISLGETCMRAVGPLME